MNILLLGSSLNHVSQERQDSRETVWRSIFFLCRRDRTAVGTLVRRCATDIRSMRLFLPAPRKFLGDAQVAYRNHPVQEDYIHLSAPFIYAEALEELRPKPGMSFLNIVSVPAPALMVDARVS